MSTVCFLVGEDGSGFEEIEAEMRQERRVLKVKDDGRRLM